MQDSVSSGFRTAGWAGVQFNALSPGIGSAIVTPLSVTLPVLVALKV